ncbi:fibronectin type III domain-containing protein, partial [Salmonella enterica subsp. enterica serovar Minnesota]|uniref:fibronectin type III domain-containing protein n=1 Tax=Salmonella enterica TaxID=28901 RepID=UPI003D2889A7
AHASSTATLSWLPPTQNADGTALTDLAGYRIRYGRNASDPDLSLDIDNPSINVYVIEQLGAGTWYFEVVALNSRGVESRP